MTWAKIDDHANEHRKQLAAGAEACWLWTCGLMYANRQSARDGFIPDGALGMLYPFKAPGKLAAKLIEAQLWHRVPGGYLIHQFDEWNESAEERDVRLGIAARRRALRFDAGLYAKLKARDGLICRYCGCPVDFAARRGPKSGTYDHVVPVVQGGGDGIENLVVSCQGCNLKKGGRTPDQAGMVLRPVPSSGARSYLDTEPGFTGSSPTPLPLPERDQPPLASLAPPWQEVLAAIEGLGPFSAADEMHDAVDRLLREHNCEVSREFEVSDRGDGRRGFVDLVAKYGDSLLAIELDRSSPRVKSVFKLRQIEAERVVVLRSCSPGNVPIIQGIRVICTRLPDERDISADDLASFAPEPAKIRAKKPKKTLTGYPDGLAPLPRQREKCAELRLDCATEFERFSAHHQAKGSVFADWSRAFDTWIGNAPGFQRGNQRVQQPKQPNGGTWKPNIERAE